MQSRSYFANFIFQCDASCSDVNIFMWFHWSLEPAFNVKREENLIHRVFWFFFWSVDGPWRAIIDCRVLKCGYFLPFDPSFSSATTAILGAEDACIPNLISVSYHHAKEGEMSGMAQTSYAHLDVCSRWGQNNADFPRSIPGDEFSIPTVSNFRYFGFFFFICDNFLTVTR